MSWSKKLRFLLLYLFIPLPLLGFWVGGIYNFITVAILFAVIPLIDYFITDPNNPTTSQESLLLQDRFFINAVLFYVPLQIILLLTSIIIVSHYPLHWYEWLGFTLSVGLITGGGGINLAHELMHKNNAFQQIMSKILLSTVCYGHFFIEHVRGHHVKVATPEDSASARFGENLYQFLPRTIIGSFKSALHLEKKRLAQKDYSLFSYHNQFWWIIGAPVAIATACFLYGGWTALFFFLGQAVVAFVVLEIVNYVEHYGLERKKLPNGHYERVSYRHSWNANHWLSNALLYHLQRHSDHHAHGARPYQLLKHHEESPQLPSGYLGMIILALIPPLWHAVMDKRVIIYRQQNEASI
ncbi:alkane 1-monooxygenase [Legionella hackeliae]|uniref:Alkane 1-monooxygenase 1 n=1 Tax=Legionella hackeliae TaxID=449 RepID=A0A0A8UU41_LEGHA|nr:alkane 1-monooxygenase [Legionella hackeliae]KTD12809.1 alkane-1-monooxygenase [Legionella hackeliae]CEK12233.1 Alkane 1-monooxygenase 1 [Legionella hackeliae]STX49019.1 alkane-1-monooxygenase [Legionella hackeliae]